MVLPYDYNAYMDKFESALECNFRCENVLVTTRWPNGVVCPHCGNTKTYLMSESGVWECSVCKRQTTVTAGTAFHSTNLELRKWFIAAYLMATNPSGISAVQLARQVAVSPDTGQSMLRKLRGVMQESNNKLLPYARVHGTHVLHRPKGNPEIKAIVSIYDEFGVLKVNLQCQDPISVANSKVQLPQQIDNPQKYSKFVASVIGHFERKAVGTYHRYSTKYAQLYADEFAYKFNGLYPAETLFRLMTDICRYGPKV